MSLYISNRQRHNSTSLNPTYVPLLLERPETDLQHRIYPIDYELSHLLIDAYEITNHGPTDLFYPILPSPCVCLYFKFSRSFACSTLCGATTSLGKLHIPPKFTVFCVRFRPGVSDFFTSSPSKDLTNSTFPVETFFPYSSKLTSDIQHGESFHERNLRIRQYLKTYTSALQYETHALLGQCVEMIHQRRGMIRVSEIASAVGCSDRYLSRVFQVRIGVSPKLYCEIIQMQFSLQEILTTRPKSLAKTAITYGYFDQPHMNRAYQKFLGRTASDMRFFDDVSCSINSISVIL